MSDEQIEEAIELIQTMLAARAGEEAKVIEGTAEPAALPAPNELSPEVPLEARASEADAEAAHLVEMKRRSLPRSRLLERRAPDGRRFAASALRGALVRPGRPGRSEPRPARLGRFLIPACPTHRQPQGSQSSGPPLRRA